MKNLIVNVVARCSLLAIVAVCTLALFLAAKPAGGPKVSGFARPENILGEVAYYRERLETALAEKERYNIAKVARVRKDALTLGALFTALAVHDQEHRLNGAAPRLVELAEQLFQSAEQYDPARAAFEQIARRIDAPAPGGKPLQWEQRGELGLLMKQVSTIDARLRRTLGPEMSERETAKSVGDATTLAVLAQATLVEVHKVKSEEDVAGWREYAAGWREAAAAVAQAVERKDPQSAAAAMRGMAKNCNGCHTKYRKGDL